MNKASIFLIGDKGWSDEVKKPEFLYLDTGFWNESIGQSVDTLYRREATRFIENCLKNGTVLLTSNVVLGELDHVIGNAFLHNYAKENNIKIPKYNNGNYNNKLLMENIVEKDKEFPLKYEKELLNVKNKVRQVCVELEYTENSDFHNLAFDIRKSTGFQLGEKDSKHYAICHINGINNIATTDGDFWRLDNANVYTFDRGDYKIKSIDRANVYLPFKEGKY